jgi:hypothetical protein
MLIRTVNPSGGRIKFTASEQDSIKTFLILGVFLALMLWLFYHGYNQYNLTDDAHPIAQFRAVQNMAIGGLGAGFTAFILFMKILVTLRGGYRVILSKNELVIIRGTKKSWASWKSLGMFQPVGSVTALLNAKITGPDISDDLKNKKEYVVGLTSSKADMLALMNELNEHCARANNFDQNQVKEIKTKIENQIAQNDENSAANKKQRLTWAACLIVFGFIGLIGSAVIEKTFAMPKRPFESIAALVVIIFAFIAAGILSKRKK